MERKGVCYDVGTVMPFNWRPSFNLQTVRKELRIIRDGLHCNAVRISGSDLSRLIPSARIGLEEGLEVWLSPIHWDKSPDETFSYATRAAAKAEGLRKDFPEHMVFVLGGELTLFMKGILEGRTLVARMRDPGLMAKVKSGEHNKPLNDFLARANASVRQAFHGQVTYASLVWEKVDWSLFDYVGVDHYRATKIEDKYVEMLKPLFSYGKPVVNTEFGYATTHGGPLETGFLSTAGLGGQQIVNFWSQFFHYMIPVLGRFVRPHLNGEHARDEGWQAKKLVETLDILDRAGVEGAFISQFESQINPYSDVPRYDLDMAGSSLVKYYEGGRRGTSYPEMNWEPKESFKAVAEYYANH